ncbi:MAG: RdgB/HAM1 family non-canonical purine NTP pyrophosphatase [Halioglobus sp.]
MSDETVVVLASGNAGKLRELQGILKPLPLQLVPQSEFQVPDVEETGLTFVENALIKARAACVHTGLAAIADDSGLEVDYLEGAPGIHSARYSGDGDSANNALLLKNLEGVPKEHRRARFQCALVFLRHAFDPTPIICQGAWEGEILDTETGSHGFGYDPLFFLPQFGCSSAELASEVKNKISHRALASAQLLEALRAQS